LARSPFTKPLIDNWSAEYKAEFDENSDLVVRDSSLAVLLLLFIHKLLILYTEVGAGFKKLQEFIYGIPRDRVKDVIANCRYCNQAAP
jgi:hypothetical protein